MELEAKNSENEKLLASIKLKKQQMKEEKQRREESQKQLELLNSKFKDLEAQKVSEKSKFDKA